MADSSQIKSDQEVLDSLSMSKIIAPVVIGVLAVVVIVFIQFDWEEFNSIKWDRRLWFYLFIAVFIYVLRHLFYSYRLKVLSDNEFTFKHSLELVCIWEFASAITPMSIGGSAVAVFFLSQEKISGAKAVSIVLYTVIIDTIFFLASMLGLYFIFGPELIRPGKETLLAGWGITFVIVLLFMLFYGSILTWGLFRPRVIRGILKWMAKLPLIKRFDATLLQTADDIMITSRELRRKPFLFHLKATIATIGAWVARFLVVNFVILALVQIPTDFWSQLLLYARSETMYVITQFSPTPGGAGTMEFFFSGFFSDFISKGIGSIGALLWRLITYYPYLLIGVFVIPNWIRKVIRLKKRRAKK